MPEVELRFESAGNHGCVDTDVQCIYKGSKAEGMEGSSCRWSMWKDRKTTVRRGPVLGQASRKGGGTLSKVSKDTTYVTTLTVSGENLGNTNWNCDLMLGSMAHALTWDDPWALSLL